MLNEKLFPDFQIGEEVVAVSKDGEVISRGPLLSLERERFRSLVFKIGGEEVNLRASWGNYLILFNANRYDEHITQCLVSELGDVTEKYMKYATRSLSVEQCGQVKDLFAQIHDIVKPMCDQEFSSRGEKGMSPESFQRMYGNSALTEEDILQEFRKSLADRNRNMFNERLNELDSLAIPDSVVAFPGGDKVVQTPLSEAKKQ